MSKIKEYAAIFYDYVQTDLTIGNMIYFGSELMKCNFEKMYTVTLPGEGVTIKGGSYYQLFAGQVLEIINAHFNPYAEPLRAGDLNIRQQPGTTTTDTPTQATQSTQSTRPSSTATEPTERTELPEPTEDTRATEEPTEGSQDPTQEPTEESSEPSSESSAPSEEPTEEEPAPSEELPVEEP